MKIIINLSFLLLFIITLHGCKTATNQAITAQTPITIEQGTITGIAADSAATIIAYKGIPYAAPPVGDLRWKAPQAAQSWEGVIAMTEYGKMSIQEENRNRKKEDMSEDCLYLNVWTQAEKKEEKLPVMVWIHGGGFTQGSGNLINGIKLTERGVVLVSINYRLGKLGFFAHPLLAEESENKVAGNYGILDMISALEWVQKNIEAFGGDPDNVSIFGESAGGAAVYILCASELSNGLFHKAIFESPWVTDGSICPLKKPSFTKESVEATSIRMADKWMGEKEVTLSGLRGLNTDDILNIAKQGFRLPAAIDGYVLKDNPANLFENGLQQSRPVIVGTNTDEGTMFSYGANKMEVQDFENNIKKEFKEGADDILGIYNVTTKAEVPDAVNQSINDSWFAQPSRWIAKYMSVKNSDTYLYHFAHQSVNWPALKSSHAAELAFVFGSLDEDKQTSSYKYLSDAMITYWTNFAKTGDPNSDGLPQWPQYKPDTDKNIILDAEISIESNYLKENLDVFDAVYKSIGKFDNQKY